MSAHGARLQLLLGRKRNGDVELFGSRLGRERSLAMTFRVRVTAVVVGFLLTAAVASAHHSFAAEFDVNKPVKLRGTLTKMEWINPHGWIYIDVKSPDGKVENWAVEADWSPKHTRR